ncbi:MAG: O-antigen ligase family protein, partial [candidate division Zixibacteria bacterium]|nr:O-antigen ligase family protein [candidate division Zixibacteria bacterium]
VKKGIHNNFKFRNFFYVFLIFSIAVFSFHDTIFSGVLERYESFIISITDPEGSIALRLILWSAAWQAFLLDPITGIGIGNFKIITEIIPQIQMATLWERVANMSAHNVFLQYLAETGIIGASALIALAAKGLKNVLPMIKMQQSNQKLQVSSAVFIAIFIFFITIFYTRDWTWGQGGYLLAFFFGLTAAHKYNQE